MANAKQKATPDLKIEEVLSLLKTSEQGLSEKEAKSRLDKYGLNEIKNEKKMQWLKILVAQFTNIMVVILIIAALVSAAIGESLEAIAIGIIVILNAIIGFIQEFRAEKAVEALKAMAAPKALVIRGGESKNIDAKLLVPGDIIVLEEGSHIPADARLITAQQLTSIEASLTGESQAAEKDIAKITSFDSIGDLKNTVFMGTNINKGHGLAVVTKTGMETEFGKIANMVQSQPDHPTPLQNQLNKLSKGIAGVTLIIVMLLFGISLFTGRDPLEMFVLSISLAVSVIPEGLPAILTLTLALGVERIARKGAIIRKLPAAETLGSTSVICSDKTGTLTQNQMTVKVVYANQNLYSVTGTGYKNNGKIEGYTENNKSLNLLLKAGLLCNNARLIKEKKGKVGISGDPTEACLLALAQKGGMNLSELNEKNPRQDELVFDSKRKRMTVRAKHQLYTKGAPSEVLEVCTHILEDGELKKLTPAMKKRIEIVNEELAKNAYRVLALATKKIKASDDTKEENLTFLGLVGMIDPPRQEAKDAIATCMRANVKVAMITGDHALTAKAIGKSIGLFKEGDEILTGRELERMSDGQLKKVVEKVKIFARVNPAHKVKILRAFRSKGHTVAMTGDGVNDAPALQNADIGVAMGITGTDVTKEASEMILTDDNFATIVESIREGRLIYENIKKFIRFLLGANFNQVLTISILFAIGMPLPYLPLQILWVNLLTDALPAIALGVDKAEEGIMERKPTKRNVSILKELVSFSILTGTISTIASLFLFFYLHNAGHDIEYIRSMMFTRLVVFEMMLVFAVRHQHKHYFTAFFSNKLLLLSVFLSLCFQVFAIYNGNLQAILETVPLSLKDWTLILSLSVSAIIVLEIWKAMTPKYKNA